MENQIAFTGALEPDQKLEVTELKILSVEKFLLLSFLSLSLYPLWWSYKVWRFFKEKDGLNILPAVRTIFSIFFLIPLFNQILKFAQSNGYNKEYSSVMLYIAIISSALIGRSSDIFALISIFSFVCFIPPLMAFNFALANSPHVEVEVQNSFNTRQIVLMAIGGIIWLFVLLGLLLMFLGIE